ncbi:MAG: FHA domain-containing protein [Deltaproteobacteria bacterium]|nr:FHA domain-containing protein [Deltaproteobacteria bacterium]
MWKVFVRDRQGHDVGQVELTGAPVTIGRDADRTLCLQSASVSRRHARLSVDAGRVFVIDEGSANGIKVDGRRISVPTPVTMESRIEIAEFVIRVVPQGASGEALISNLALQARRPAPAQAVVAPRGVAPQHYDVTAPFQQSAAGAPPSDATTPPVFTNSVIASGPAPQSPGRPSGVRPAVAPVGHPGAGAPPPGPPGTPVTLSGALAAVRGAGVRLVGRGGPYDGRVFELGKPEAFVGRVAGNDLVLDDNSISRRHARLRLVDGGARLEVFDLRSANGTFINGERTKLDACGPGDKLRFGDLLFRVESTTTQPQSSTQLVGSAGRKKRAALVGGVAFVLLAAIIGAAVWKRGQKPIDAGPDARERLARMQTRVQERVDAGKVAMKQQRWGAAEKAFAEALEVDPLNDEAQKLKGQARREVEHADVFKQGNEAFELGTRQNLERARETYKQIPAESFYHAQVKYRLKQINRSLADTYRIDGISQLKARYPDKAQAALCTFFELMGDDEPTPGEDKIRTALADAEHRLKRHKDFKPCQAARYVGRVKAGGTSVDPEEELKGKYEEPKLREAVLLYVSGKIDPALKKLKTLESDKTVRESLTLVREVRRNLEVARGKFEEGFSLARQRKADEARREWEYVIESDRALLPTGVESWYRQEITRLLGDLYYDLGDEEFKGKRFREAYAKWDQGRRAAPKHGGILNGLLKLEEEARKALEEAGGLPAFQAKAKLTLARDITAPGSKVHDDAVKALGE